MPSPRQQFNVSLPPDLVRRVKHHAIDVQLSLSDLVAHVLQAELAQQEDTVTTPSTSEPGIRLRPMVHVQDMVAAVAFYEALGAQILHGSRDGDWVLLALGEARIGLLAHPPNPDQDEGTVEMNFEAVEPLDRLEERLRAAGVTIARPTTDEGFGRQLQLSSPDGLLIKIDELDPELYT
jgi:predicted enzyme related to lactoylglutathione lyase